MPQLASALLYTPHSRGEINQYTKSHIQRVITKLPKTVCPSIFTAFEYDKYRYTKIASDRDIRLLKLHPPGTGLPNATTDDFISCELEEVAFSDNPKYEAFSYAWGFSPRDYPVIVMPAMSQTEKPCMATALLTNPSLYTALKLLRHPTQSRALWIDQLCINQDDNEEKSKQVVLMADIYKNAQQTLIWLGEEDGDKKVLSEMVELFASRPPSCEETGCQPRQDDARSGVYRKQPKLTDMWSVAPQGPCPPPQLQLVQSGMDIPECVYWNRQYV
jgi:hypothetical protein